MAELSHPSLDQTPRSWSGLFGTVGFLAAIALTVDQQLDTSARVLICGAATAVPMILHDLLWLRVHRRASAGLMQDTRHFSPKRVLLKTIGLITTLAIIAGAYWLFREYHGQFYAPFWRCLERIALPFAILTVPYISWVDAHMSEPRDGYYQLGALVAGPLVGVSRRDVDTTVLANFGRGWLVKAFFLPLMVVYLGKNLDSVPGRWARFDGFDGFTGLYDLAWLGLYTVDVGFAAVGYAMTFRVLDAHTRSAEPTMIGWALCLICYQPFWSTAERLYLHYDNGNGWGKWLADLPWLHDIWGSAIIALTAIYVWATVSFGLRFSNLTHRGVIAFGPYRWVRHPAYLSKNLSWWLVAIPFVSIGDWQDTVRACISLALINGIYAARGWTEERHLSRDEAYLAYRRQTPWLGARVRRWLSKKPETTG
ncbi:MAG: DUF1295 domain-containing protein [Myxococcales bacterium]|nr:DUF1295 domain-containing protein [Myxococcales bacterium]